MIFQSVGSNYNFRYAMKHLFAIGNAKDSKKLTEVLSSHYGGRAILYSKGRNALSAAVKLVAEGKSIAINGITCSVVPEAITSANAKPVFIDIDNQDGNFSIEKLEQEIARDSNIKAIIIQNTYGNTADISSIEKLAKSHNLYLIEDLAHSLGQKYPDGRETGTVGDLVMLSFGRDKIIDCANGGALIIHSPELAANLVDPTALPSKLNQFRNRIYPVIFYKVRLTYKFAIGKLLHRFAFKLGLVNRSADGGINQDETLPAWQAKLILPEIENLADNLTHRNKIVKIYREKLDELIIGNTPLIRVPLFVKDRARVLQILAEKGFKLHDTWYDKPIGPARKYIESDYPTAENINSIDFTNHVINLPTHRSISEKQAYDLAEIIREAIS